MSTHEDRSKSTTLVPIERSAERAAPDHPVLWRDGAAWLAGVDCPRCDAQLLGKWMLPLVDEDTDIVRRTAERSVRLALECHLADVHGELSVPPLELGWDT